MSKKTIKPRLISLKIEQIKRKIFRFRDDRDFQLRAALYVNSLKWEDKERTIPRVWPADEAKRQEFLDEVSATVTRMNECAVLQGVTPGPAYKCTAVRKDNGELELQMREPGIIHPVTINGTFKDE